MPQNLSVNDGKSNFNADYKTVIEQTGFFNQSYDLNVDGKGIFTGAVFTTATPEVNQTTFGKGTEVSDIQNYSNYSGSSIQGGLNVGMNTGGIKPPAPQDPPVGRESLKASHSMGYGKDSDSQTSTTYGGVTGMAGNVQVTTANATQYAGVLDNTFNADKVNKELGAQVNITQQFDQVRTQLKSEINQKIDEIKKQRDSGEITAAQYEKQVANLQHSGLLLDGIAGGLSNPTGSLTNVAVSTVSPVVSYQIGQYFKSNNAEGSAAHIVAHTLLGAATAAAGGGDAAVGAAIAGGSEVAAPRLAQYIYGKPASELNAEQKQTISSILSAAGGAVGVASGDVNNVAVNQKVVQNAVEDNGFNLHAKTPADLKIKQSTFNEQYLYPGLRTVGGGIGIFTGIGLCETGIGCILGAPILAMGIDDYSTGMKNFGKPGMAQDLPVRQQTLINMGLSPTQAFYITLAGDIILPTGASALNLYKTTKYATVTTEAAQQSKYDFLYNNPDQYRKYLAEQAVIPQNIASNPAIMWGKTPEQLVQSLEMEGATLTRKPPQIGPNNEPSNAIVYEVRYGDTPPSSTDKLLVNPSSIKEIEYHPGGGYHTPNSAVLGSPYYKIKLNNGTQIRVIDPTKPFNTGTITSNQIYMNPQGQILKKVNNQWVVK